MYNWTDIINCIKSSNDIVLFTHTNMDGDALGSTSALCHALRKMGKNAVILLEDKIPEYLDVITYKEKENEDPFYVEKMPFKSGLAIVVDCGDKQRIEKRLNAFKKCEKSICIDHHIQTKAFTDYYVIDPDVAATGMLIYDLIKELGVIIDKFIAESLYVAIVTDTGRFKYSNTNAEVHKIVADIYQYGIDHVKLCNEIYDSHPIEQLNAELFAREAMEIFADGKAVVSYITLKKMKELGAEYEQVDTCIDTIRVVKGVEIAAFIKEKEKGVFKVSFRAKNYADVNAVAKVFGGGGHEKASGATLTCTLKQAIKLVKAEVEKELSKY